MHEIRKSHAAGVRGVAGNAFQRPQRKPTPFPIGPTQARLYQRSYGTSGVLAQGIPHRLTTVPALSRTASLFIGRSGGNTTSNEPSREMFDTGCIVYEMLLFVLVESDPTPRGGIVWLEPCSVPYDGRRSLGRREQYVSFRRKLLVLEPAIQSRYPL